MMQSRLWSSRYPGPTRSCRYGTSFGCARTSRNGLPVQGVPPQEPREVLAAGHAVAAQRVLFAVRRSWPLRSWTRCACASMPSWNRRRSAAPNTSADHHETVRVEQELVRVRHAVRERTQRRRVVARAPRRQRAPGGRRRCRAPSAAAGHRAPRGARGARRRSRARLAATRGATSPVVRAGPSARVCCARVCCASRAESRF